MQHQALPPCKQERMTQQLLARLTQLRDHREGGSSHSSIPFMTRNRSMRQECCAEAVVQGHTAAVVIRAVRPRQCPARQRRDRADTGFAPQSPRALKTVMVSATSPARITGQSPTLPGTATRSVRRSTPSPVALGPTERYPAIGMGAPWYVSGTQLWKGTRVTLKS